MNPFKSIASWFQKKSVVAGQQWSGTNYIDAYRQQRAPTPNELMTELKNTAWSCISINSAVCASNPPQLYVSTEIGQADPKCMTKKVPRGREKELQKVRRKAMRIEEVTEHPLLELLEQVNPVHNAFDLWELTTLYQEVHGIAYWYLSKNAMGIPDEIWILPTQNVTPYKSINSNNIVDAYIYKTGATQQAFEPSEIIAFRYPDPRNPYISGLSPLRACFEQVALTSDYAAMKKAIYDNRGIPSAIVSPDEAMGSEERDMLEAQWNQKFRKGGSGRLLVAESKMNVSILQQSMGDLAQLAEMQATKEDICNAFHVPISYMTANTNFANLIAAERQHTQNAIGPRLIRRDEKLNEQLIPLYDPSRRLFFASSSPTPIDQASTDKRFELEMKYGILTINEVRLDKGLEPVPWGDVPWKPNAKEDNNGVQ